MAGVSDTRRVTKKRSGRTRLTVVGGGGDRSGRGELAELRMQFAASGAPEQVLHVLDASCDVEDAVGRLLAAGLLPEPEESLAGLLDGWTFTLEAGCDPLTVELSGAEFLGMIRQTLPDDVVLPELLTGLIEQARDYASAEALAMLRVLAVLAPDEVRPAAATAADSLVAAGLTDPPWAGRLGRPAVGRSFGYADALGAQQSIAVTFSYGRRRHALVVLIDHELGGGVKDCFPTDRPDWVRARYQRAAQQFGLEFCHYPPAEAGEILRRALSRPPCPVEADQIEDVGEFLGLLRTRVDLLPAVDLPAAGVDLLPAPPADGHAGHAGRGAGASRPPRGRQARTLAGRTVHRVKITLRGARPPIWRRLEVPSEITLDRLHLVVQEAFGWSGSHLWAFSTPGGEYGIADQDSQHRSAAAKKLSDVALTGGRLQYLYDFGDGWAHDITVEDVAAAKPSVTYPRCTAGRRACPPEDCGGIGGYEHLLAILADPRHKEHADRLHWLGLERASQFNAAAFDLTEVNTGLAGLARVLVKR
jgi:Plasmid pRiA4b ORF-3-like protein